MDIAYLKKIVEGALLAAAQPLSLHQLNSLFDEDERPGHGALREALAALDAELGERAVELVEVGSGFRLQIRSQLMPVISTMWTEKSPRYSRALLETLAIIAYRQPITRGDIERIRGVSISSNILRTLQERDWIQVVGHRDVPGRPELLGSTKAFLDYFNLNSLDQLPTLAEIKDIDQLEPELELSAPHSAAGATIEGNPTSRLDEASEPPHEQHSDGTIDKDSRPTGAVQGSLEEVSSGEVSSETEQSTDNGEQTPSRPDRDSA